MSGTSPRPSWRGTGGCWVMLLLPSLQTENTCLGELETPQNEAKGLRHHMTHAEQFGSAGCVLELVFLDISPDTDL